MQLPVHLDVPDAFRPRASYALETLLGGLGVQPVWTNAAPVVSVGLRPAPAPVQLPLSPDALAFFDSGVRYEPNEAFCLDIGGDDVPVLFGTREAPDLVSSAFFWLSGWQERAAQQVDAHGRFPYSASLQAALGTALLPTVDAYATHLEALLRRAGHPAPGKLWGSNTWALCPTHDIDAVRKWTPKSLWRGLKTPGVLWQAATEGDPFRRGLVRLVVETRRRGVGATYYLKAGGSAPEDHRYSLRQPMLRGLLGHPAFEVGLHPSYHAYNYPAALARERDALARAAGRSITAVRNHYLRWEAGTPALQERTGFSTDSTLAWAEHEGWRRGTCRPFRLYDLCADRATSVWEMPLALMDTTLFGYRDMGEAEAGRVTRRVLDAVQRYRGVCVALWHNSVWDGPAGEVAGRHFLSTLDAALDARALVTSVGAALERWCGDFGEGISDFGLRVGD